MEFLLYAKDFAFISTTPLSLSYTHSPSKIPSCIGKGVAQGGGWEFGHRFDLSSENSDSAHLGATKPVHHNY